MCYIRGCHQTGQIGFHHSIFGFVASCFSHYTMDPKYNLDQRKDTEAISEAPPADIIDISHVPEKYKMMIREIIKNGSDSGDPGHPVLHDPNPPKPVNPGGSSNGLRPSFLKGK